MTRLLRNLRLWQKIVLIIVAFVVPVGVLAFFTFQSFEENVDICRLEQNGTATAPPYLALVDALDAMVEAGALSPERRVGAEWPCWSAVHGFAELVLHGPLRDARRRDVETLAGRTVDDIIAGVAG